MNLTAIIDEIRAERDLVVEAILSLERLAGGRGKRRGRPPGWLAAVLAEADTESQPKAKVRKKKRAKSKKAGGTA